MSSVLLFIIIISLISDTCWKVNSNINWIWKTTCPWRLTHFVWQFLVLSELNMKL